MQTDWKTSIEPLLVQFGQRKHPLEYQNRYQLLVMVVLSASSTDKYINKIAPSFFKLFPTITDLSKASIEELHEQLSSVVNYKNKSQWLLETAKMVGSDEQIPTGMASLTKLPGIGRKSANVIIRESGGNAEGIIVDLHVLRVAPRIGLAEGTNPEKIEKQLMEKIPQPRWNETGMAISFLGREICRPSKPKCGDCVMNPVCAFYLSQKR